MTPLACISKKRLEDKETKQNIEILPDRLRVMLDFFIQETWAIMAMRQKELRTNLQ